MKKIGVIALCIIFIFLEVTPVLAESKDTEQYYKINAEFSDRVGSAEQISIMVLDNHVYGNAGELAKRLGYEISETDDKCVTIYNKTNNDLPYGITQFYYNDIKVNHLLLTKMVDDYRAPFPTIKNGEGIWIPLEYSLLLLNSSMAIIDDTVLIDIPEKNIVDMYMDIMKNNDTYRFEWNKDFGYTEFDWMGIGSLSHGINLLNGILEFDGASWVQLFQHIPSDMSSYDQKYGKKLSMLICTESDKELEQAIDSVKKCKDLFSSEGKLFKILSRYSQSLDNEVEAIYNICEKIMKDVDAGNSGIAVYNRSYQALKNALDRQTWFSKTGQNILDVQKGVSNAFPFMEAGLEIAEVVKYGEEFKNQDEFSVQAFTAFLTQASQENNTSKAMMSSMIEYADKLQTDILEYTAARYFNENVDDWIKKGVDISTGGLGNQATKALLAWSLASNFVPFIENGLSAADKFELSLYASLLQTDAFIGYQRYRNQIFQSVEDITPDNLYKLSQYGYVYLKSCYVARDAALGSLTGKRDEIKEQIQPLIRYQNEINGNIAKILIKLKNADKTNEKMVYGFLPCDNQKYLENYSDDNLLGHIDHMSLPVFDEEYLKELLLQNTSEPIINFIYDDFDKNGVNEAIAFCGEQDDFDGSYYGTLYFVTGEGVKVVREKDGYWNSGEIYDFGDVKIISITEYYTTGGISFYYQVNGDEIMEIDGSGMGDGLFQDEQGRMCMTDSQYDAGVDGSGHTWNIYYFYWDNGLKEYGGTEITYDEFSIYDGAEEILQKITEDGNYITSILKRRNGIININCCDGVSNGNVRVIYENGKVELSPVTEDYFYEEGIIKPALIPEIASYSL